MNAGSVIWLVVFGLTALVFFGVAAVVAWKGFEDLKELLRRGERKGDT